MIALSIAILCNLQTDTPEAALKSVYQSLRSLDSLQVDVVQDWKEGLYAGSYTQSLTWSKAGRFVLVVTKLPGDKLPKGSMVAPDWLCDSKMVTVIPKGPGRFYEAAKPPPNEVLTWEVGGGLLISWLMDTPTGQFMFTPPEGIKLEMKFGSKTEWQGEKVRQIEIKVAGAKNATKPMYLYISPDAKTLIGQESDFTGRKGLMVYKNQKPNVEVPDTLGAPPPSP